MEAHADLVFASAFEGHGLAGSVAASRRAADEAIRQAEGVEESDGMQYFFALILGGLLASAASGQGTLQTLLPPGDLSTRGNQIVDQGGRPVRLACVGWTR